MTPRTHMTRSRTWATTCLRALFMLCLLCSYAHAGQVRTNFDHDTTGFELTGQHRDLRCEACHANAIFKGTPRECGACHGVGTVIRATAKPANHILSTNACGVCHATTAWNPAVNFDHNQALGSCSTCHNGVQAQGKPPTHLVTDLECDACHTTMTWSGAVFSHQGISSGCASCHNNVQAVGMPPTHVPVAATPCEGCHSTTNFVSFAGTHINHAAVAALSCASCHETAAFLGMHPSTNTTAGDSRPSATLDKAHPATGDCGQCHDTTTFASTALRPANHIPTSAPCAQCHTTAGNYAAYSLGGVHQGVTTCLSCHGANVGPFANVSPVTLPGTHIPIGSLDCNGSGCHTTTNLSPGGFSLGTANISKPTLSTAGHTSVAAAVSGCQSCHETAPYLGMLPSTATAPGDSRPTALDKNHPTTGECSGCHSTTPSFGSNLTNAAKPANHIPTTAPCAQCHTTGNYAAYSLSGTHQGVSGCLSCHGATLTYANVTTVGAPAGHVPIGSLDCNGSGCHTTANVNPGGFKLGNASISAPTLSVAGHTTVSAAVPACQSCHETAPFLGMLASTATVAADSRPTAFDSAHPTSGDCGNCHVTTPTFASNLLPTAPKPANHIPTNATCAQCHTTAGNFALYSVGGTHTGLTSCLSCHAPAVAGTFANVTIVTLPGNHMPVGALDCGSSGCHTTKNVNPGGFKIGAASITAPTLTVAGHTTVAAAVSGCQTCHESAAYVGMLPSTATVAGDSRPTAFDKGHPTSGDCNGCHTSTPTFTSNVTGGSKPSNHIPTNAPCAQCHTTAGNYAAYVMGAAGHKGINNNCAQCHAYGLSFYNMAPPTLIGPPSGATGHIPAVPPNGTAAIACELCHSPANFTTFSGTIMRHAYVTTMKCVSCHERGMKWKTNSGVQLWVRPQASHHAGQDCNGSGCHTSRDKFALRPVVARPAGTARTPPSPTPSSTAGTASVPASLPGPFVHPARATGACVSCHQGAAGRPATHIATSDRCEQCHTTIAWLPVRLLDHTQVKGSCVSCHDAVRAAGKPARHLQTSAPCEGCHTTNAWTAARVDHAAVAAHTCSNCHNSVQATGLPRAHVPTTQPCDSCHGTLGWRPARVDHSRLAGACTTCHNNVAAIGLPPGHLQLRRDCAECHAYPDWTLVRFQHSARAYPGSHRAQLSCNACHTANTEAVPYSSPGNAGTCAACHAHDFVPAAHPKIAKDVSYTVSELANCTGACHVYGDVTQQRIVKPLPGPHHRVSDAAFKH